MYAIEWELTDYRYLPEIDSEFVWKQNIKRNNRVKNMMTIGKETAWWKLEAEVKMIEQEVSLNILTIVL